MACLWLSGSSRSSHGLRLEPELSRSLKWHALDEIIPSAMNVILDSNVYISDYRMESISFKNLFDYLKRTGDAIVLLGIVKEEVIAHFGRDLKKKANEVEKAWKAYRLLRFPNKLPEFTKPDIADQQNLLSQRLMKPSEAVASEYYADTTKVSVDEIARRGVHRIPPANDNGEELRDVIVWLSSLDYAKTKNREVAFITNDSGFWVNDVVRPEIQEDIQNAGVIIRPYQSIGRFVEENSPPATVVEEKWAYEIFPEFNESVTAAAESAIRSTMPYAYIGSVSITSVDFKEGTRFEVAPDVQVAELLFAVGIEFHTRTVLNVAPTETVYGVGPSGMINVPPQMLNVANPQMINVVTSQMVRAVDVNSYWGHFAKPNVGSALFSPYGSSVQTQFSVIEDKYLATGTVRAFARLLKGRISEKETTEFHIEKIDLLADKV